MTVILSGIRQHGGLQRDEWEKLADRRPGSDTKRTVVGVVQIRFAEAYFTKPSGAMSSS